MPLSLFRSLEATLGSDPHNAAALLAGVLSPADPIAQHLDLQLARPLQSGYLLGADDLPGQPVGSQEECGRDECEHGNKRRRRAPVAIEHGIEAATVEAACGSGGAAARWGVMAIQSYTQGFHFKQEDLDFLELVSTQVDITPIRAQLLHADAPLGEVLMEFWLNSSVERKKYA